MTRGWPSSAGATCRSTTAACGEGAREVLPHLAQLFVAGRSGRDRPDPRPDGLLPAQAGRARARRLLRLACPPGPSSTRACCPRRSSSRSSPTCPTTGTRPTLALVHSRFSTNTFPSWPLAHPYRYVAHNGEINTVQGNRNWMRAREAMLASPLIPASKSGQGIERLFPIIDPEGSDSARSTSAWNCCTWAAGRCRTRC